MFNAEEMNKIRERRETNSKVMEMFLDIMIDTADEDDKPLPLLPKKLNHLTNLVCKTMDGTKVRKDEGTAVQYARDAGEVLDKLITLLTDFLTEHDDL